MSTTDTTSIPALRFRIEVFAGGRPEQLTVGEAGALLTALNRSVNALVADSGELTLGPDAYSRAAPSHEPDIVQLPIVNSRHGSLEVQAIIEILNAVGLDSATAKGILAGILGNAIWDPGRAVRISKDFGRAIRRLGRGAKRRTYRLTIWMHERKKTFVARVTDENKVKVEESEADHDA